MTPPLRTVRQAQALSLREVSRRAGIDAAHLSRIERGESSPSVDVLARVAAVLGLRTLAGLLEPYKVSPAATGNHKPAGDAPAGSVAADSNQLGAQAALLPGAVSPVSDPKGQTCHASTVTTR
jgi:transcriptional regulator with XRE-family HTH domain